MQGITDDEPVYAYAATTNVVPENVGFCKHPLSPS